MQSVRWGVIGTGKIGREKTIPAMQKSPLCDVRAIASRDLTNARAAAAPLGIRVTYGSYEALLADPEIDAVYISLPNHLHVPWSIHALEAGKHVLCEKPIALDAKEAEALLAVSRAHPALKVMEAFMYRQHPQWQQAHALVRGGSIGDLRCVHSVFSYHNVDPTNVRNQANIGGGGLMDIGCYNVSLSRFLFDTEPKRVVSAIERDPTFKTDNLTSALFDFEPGHATFTCSTRLTPFQRVHIFGTEGRVELEIPFNAPPDAPHRLWHHPRGKDVIETIVGPHDQYTIQADLFSRAILEHTPVPTPLEDAVANMQAIDAVFRSASTGQWEPVG